MRSRRAAPRSTASASGSATTGAPGPPVRVEVRRRRSGRGSAPARLAGGYPGVATEHVVAVGDVRTDDPLRVCLINEGAERWP